MTAAVAVGCATHLVRPEPAPPLDGRCGGEPGICLLGTPAPPGEGGAAHGWQCLGLNGGANAACTLPLPALPPPVSGESARTQPAESSPGAVAPAAVAPEPGTVSGAQSGGMQAAAAAQRAQAQIADLLAAKARRTPAQRKVGSDLLERAASERLRGAGQPLPENRQPLADASPDAEHVEDGRVLVDIRAEATPAVLARIRELGGSVVNSVPRYAAIRALLPLPSIERLAALDDIRSIRTADKARTQGQVAALPVAADPAVTRRVDTTAGDIAHQVNLARQTHGVDGTGIGIGVLSNGVETLADRQASGDLPARVTVLPGQEGTGDEGTAMLEIVHDLAPGADLYFATAFGGQASFAANIEALWCARQTDEG